MTLLAPRSGNDVSYVTRINDEIHFVWQAQYLVKLECDFSWQAQHFVTFWEIAGARNVAFFNTKSSTRLDREGSPKRRVRDDHFILGLSSDCVRIVFLLAEAIQGFPVEILTSEFRGRRSTWVKLECDFSWQAQRFVTFWEIAGARNLAFFNTKSSTRLDREGLRSARVRDDHFILGLSSDCVRIVFLLAEAIHGFPVEILTSEFRGRRSTW